MKIAVLGDIHSNHTALETCITHALERNVDEFMFLGDYISDCAYPQKTMQIVYDMNKKYSCRFIRGNREDYMLHHRKDSQEVWTYSSTTGSLLYTYENLSESDLDFFEGLAISGFSVTVGNKKWVNPGSVGVPIGHGGKSQYMILHGTKGGWQEEFFQLEYDVDTVVKEYELSGLDQKAPWWTRLNIHLLYTGEDHSAACIMLARELCEEAGEEVNGLDIPERYMEMAVKRLELNL